MDEERTEDMGTTRNAGPPGPVVLLTCVVAFVVTLGLALYVLLHVGRDGIHAFADWSANDPTGQVATLAFVAVGAALGIWEARKTKGWAGRTWEILMELVLLAIGIYVFLHW